MTRAMTFPTQVLAVNAGSSSLKIRLLGPDDQHCDLLVEHIGEDRGAVLHVDGDALRTEPLPDHDAALTHALQALESNGRIDPADPPAAVGHRVVHGGEHFHAATRINAENLAALRALSALAPLHNPVAVSCIEHLQAHWPEVPQVAVFDTAFHHDLPPAARHYALPASLCREHGIRRYGFHGISVSAVVRATAQRLARPVGELNLIVAHLGSGASMTAVRGGRSVETSMGFTPLEGLVMGSRCGDIDPAILTFLQARTGIDAARLDDLLNHHSGLKGICGENDLRAIHRRAGEGDQDAQLALDVFVHRIRKYLGAYTAILGQVDALVFTAGIGEHDAAIRSAVCAGLDNLGYVVDKQANEKPEKFNGVISAASSRASILVIPTDEEREIARQALETIQSEEKTT
ncbi:MAG: acetate/propionate family kinase [Halothiobacillaceae bacterium]